jgi:CRP-like cAMP-binding protein
MLARRWLSSVAARLMSAERRILQLAGRDLKTQLANLLLDEERDGSVALPQGSLASLLGVRRPSLNKVLKDLERAGSVTLSYGCVDIADRRGLERAAGRASD